MTNILAALVVCASISVTDGDTFRCSGERVRILGIDAPEMRARCVGEKISAHRAKRRLGELLRGQVIIARHGRDRYGRTLAHVSANGADVAGVMLAEGLVREWTGRREPWCNG